MELNNVPEKTSHLLSLPLELRLQIFDLYEQDLEARHCSNCNSFKQECLHLLLPVLQVNHQLRHEALSHYGKTMSLLHRTGLGPASTVFECLKGHFRFVRIMLRAEVLFNPNSTVETLPDAGRLIQSDKDNGSLDMLRHLLLSSKGDDHLKIAFIVRELPKLELSNEHNDVSKAFVGINLTNFSNIDIAWNLLGASSALLDHFKDVTVRTEAAIRQALGADAVEDQSTGFDELQAPRRLKRVFSVRWKRH